MISFERKQPRRRRRRMQSAIASNNPKSSGGKGKESRHRRHMPTRPKESRGNRLI